MSFCAARPLRSPPADRRARCAPAAAAAAVLLRLLLFLRLLLLLLRLLAVAGLACGQVLLHLSLLAGKD